MSNGCSPVIFIPGVMGSKLERQGDLLWGNIGSLFRDLNALALPDSAPVQATEIIQDIFVGPYCKLFYRPLVKFLRDKLGYDDRPNGNLFLFAYDWRKDCGITAGELHAHAVRLHELHGKKVVLLAHSMGGLIARYYVNSTINSADLIKRIVTMGTPLKGAPDSFESLQLGADILPFGLRRSATRDAIRTFPSTYQLLPYDSDFIIDDNNRVIDIFKDKSWVDNPDHRNLLIDALQFHKNLGKARQRSNALVPVYGIYGYGHTTLTRVCVPTYSHARWWTTAKFQRFVNTGDGRVPVSSAKTNNAKPVAQKHGALFRNLDVQQYISDLLCSEDAPPHLLEDSQEQQISPIIEMNSSLFNPGDNAQVLAGLVDQDHPTSLHNIRISVTVRSGDEEIIGTHESTSEQGNRLAIVEFQVPRQPGGYAVEVLIHHSLTEKMEPVIDYFGVTNEIVER